MDVELITVDVSMDNVGNFAGRSVLSDDHDDWQLNNGRVADLK
jgi:hypothetical protein